MDLTVRRATASDLIGIEAIQIVSPGAVQWNPADYLFHECWVAVMDEAAGFVVVRKTGPGEGEVLNLAVLPRFRRAGIARTLLQTVLGSEKLNWFLEVRESNAAAIALYSAAGFDVVGRREKYYHDPCEAALVMRRIS
jgi:ribosomal protein S18 acetylase RimI-like enzyme